MEDLQTKQDETTQVDTKQPEVQTQDAQMKGFLKGLFNMFKTSKQKQVTQTKQPQKTQEKKQVVEPVVNPLQEKYKEAKQSIKQYNLKLQQANKQLEQNKKSIQQLTQKLEKIQKAQQKKKTTRIITKGGEEKIQSNQQIQIWRQIHSDPVKLSQYMKNNNQKYQSLRSKFLTNPKRFLGK